MLLNPIDGFRNLPNPEVEGKRQDHFVDLDGQPDELADKLLVGLLGGLLVGLLVDLLVDLPVDLLGEVFGEVLDEVHPQTWKAPLTVDFLSP